MCVYILKIIGNEEVRGVGKESKKIKILSVINNANRFLQSFKLSVPIYIHKNTSTHILYDRLVRQWWCE